MNWEIRIHGEKIPFDIPRMFRLVRMAIRPYARAMLFELYDRGHTTPFEILVACILSIRTRDEVSLIVTERLFATARTPREFYALSLGELASLIEPCQFPYQKARSIRQIAHIVLQEHQGQLPCEFDLLASLPGVGPKCASLTLGISCGQSQVGVDTHVHRVTNRWGLVQAKTPEKTKAHLEERLPISRWVEINELLVPFGKHICLSRVPKCSQCPVLTFCRQVGVNKMR